MRYLFILVIHEDTKSYIVLFAGIVKCEYKPVSALNYKKKIHSLKLNFKAMDVFCFENFFQFPCFSL